MHLEKCFKNDPKNKTLLVEKLRKSFEKNLEIDEMDPSLYTNAIGDTVDFYIDFPEPQISYKQTGTYYSSFQKKTFAMEVCTVSLSVLLFNKEGNLLGKKSFDLISRQPYGDRNEALTSALKDKYINNIPEFINPHLK